MIKAVLAVILVICIIGVIVLAAFVISAVVTYIINMNKAVHYALANKKQCGKTYCAAELVDLNIPEEFPTEYNNTLARYCADLVVRVEEPLYTKHAQVKTPKGMKLLKDVYESDNHELIFGTILTEGQNIWVAYRGTANIDEWKDDFTYNQTGLPGKKTLFQVPAPFLKAKSGSNNLIPKVHKGFTKIYMNFRKDLLDILKKYPHKFIIITGHSLGAGLATLTALDLANQGYNNVLAYTFASPRVGDQTFCELVNDKVHMFRIHNTCDIIPTLPFAVSPNLNKPEEPYMYQHCGQSIEFTDNWLSAINNHIMSVHIKFLNKQGKLLSTKQ